MLPAAPGAAIAAGGSTAAAPLDHARPDTGRRRIVVFYVIEGITSHSVALMLASIYFYTTARFGWRSAENFTLAATLGVVYVAGALSAHAVATRLGRRQTLVTVYLLMSACAWVATIGRDSPWVLVPALFFYSG